MNDKTQIAEGEIVESKELSTPRNNTPAIINEDSSALVMVASAVANGAGGDEVDKMIDLIKFNDSREAEKGFNISFTKAQSEFPEIKRKREGVHGSKFASYDDVVTAIRPTLKSNGLSFRHDVDVVIESGMIVVTCFLAHKKGHSVTAKLLGAPDTSGNKQAIQATASTVSYLKRYTLEAVCGVSSNSDEDTDGFVQKEELISEQQALELHALITENRYKVDDWVRHFSNYEKRLQMDSLEDLPLKYFNRSLQNIKSAVKQAQQQKGK